jgi:hypothetical protein
MLVEVEFDFWVKAGFYIFERWPLDLIDSIGAAKRDMFQTATPDPLEPELRIGQRTFELGGRRLLVIYAAGDPYFAESGERVERLRVLRIEEP